VALTRSQHMARIRAKDTLPELLVRSCVHRLGYRFTLHRRDLPGTPDLVFPSRRCVVFVHGCFWHQHPCASCRIAHQPKSNVPFWLSKLSRNVERDARNIAALRTSGWRVLVLWECELDDPIALAFRVLCFLEGAACPD
jgi:DNA mismatch endonuclease, patch repair protein